MTKDTSAPAQLTIPAFAIRVLISAVAITALILKSRYWHDPQYDFSRDELILLAAAAVPWLAQFIRTFKIGKGGVEVTTQDFREVRSIAKAALDASLRGVKGKDTAPSTLPSATAVTTTAVPGNDDPQKGIWGELPTANHRELKARIEQIPGEDYFRRVILTVCSTDADHPLTGKVTFHLHPTFSEPDFDEPVVDGVATTSLVSYGAFTVGAEADNGKTRLELDLKSLDDGKDQFFKR